METRHLLMKHDTGCLALVGKHNLCCAKYEPHQFFGDDMPGHIPATPASDPLSGF